MSGQMPTLAATRPLRQQSSNDDSTFDNDADDLLARTKQQRRLDINNTSNNIPISASNCNIEIINTSETHTNVDPHVIISYNGNNHTTASSVKGEINFNELEGLQEVKEAAVWKSQQSKGKFNISGNSNKSDSSIYDISPDNRCSDLSINGSESLNNSSLPLTNTSDDKKLDNIATVNRSDQIRNGDSATATAASVTSHSISQISNRPSQPVHYYHQQPSSVSINSSSDKTLASNHQVDSRLRFKSLLVSSSIQESDEQVEVSEQESLKPKTLVNSRSFTSSNSSTRCDRLDTIDEDKREHLHLGDEDEEISLDNLNCSNDDGDLSEEDELFFNAGNESRNSSRGSGRLLRLHDRSNTKLQLRSRGLINFEKLKYTFKRRVVNLLFGGSAKIKSGDGGSSLIKAGRSPVSSDSDHQLYTAYNEDNENLLTGTSKYQSSSRRKKHIPLGKTFRGSYKYSRTKITMAILKKIVNLMINRSTLALFGAFLIHITLGTVYTLSNINSYMTSYMRKHGSPNATYGGAMWISSSYAVGQGFSMVLGGYIEKRFSARLSCFIGCALHSLSTIATSWAMDHGPLAVLLTYGFIPGFGCGLAYMTPMSNGFGWFPNRKGLVAGVILAGFGIGTFIFNMAQTAYVNPNNLSPAAGADGYFTQESILIKVPQLFIFIGCIYATMQFIGCCLLFKPPNPYMSNSDTARPILVETEMPLKQSIRRPEFYVLFLVYGITTPGILFVNSMLKEYGQMFIGDDMYLAWTGSMGSIANAAGRLGWGLAIDKFSFTQCFTSITVIFGTLMLLMPFQIVLSSKLLYLLCTLGIFGSFSGWMSTYPVHLSRVFGRTNSGMIYGLIFMSQSFGGIVTALGAHYLIDHYSRFVPFFCVVFLELIGLSIYHLFYPK